MEEVVKVKKKKVIKKKVSKDVKPVINVEAVSPEFVNAKTIDKEKTFWEKLGLKNLFD